MVLHSLVHSGQEIIEKLLQSKHMYKICDSTTSFFKIRGLFVIVFLQMIPVLSLMCFIVFLSNKNLNQSYYL